MALAKIARYYTLLSIFYLSAPIIMQNAPFLYEECLGISFWRVGDFFSYCPSFGAMESAGVRVA
jgi:hypothetical protein